MIQELKSPRSGKVVGYVEVLNNGTKRFLPPSKWPTNGLQIKKDNRRHVLNLGQERTSFESDALQSHSSYSNTNGLSAMSAKGAMTSMSYGVQASRIQQNIAKFLSKAQTAVARANLYGQRASETLQHFQQYIPEKYQSVTQKYPQQPRQQQQQYETRRPMTPPNLRPPPPSYLPRSEYEAQLQNLKEPILQVPSAEKFRQQRRRTEEQEAPDYEAPPSPDTPPDYEAPPSPSLSRQRKFQRYNKPVPKPPAANGRTRRRPLPEVPSAPSAPIAAQSKRYYRKY